MEQLKELGKQIRQKRLSMNMTMNICAKKAGITRATLWSIEKGTSNCSIVTLFNLLQILDLSINVTNTCNSERIRATRTNTLLNKKINEFIIACVEEYASYIGESSKETYKQLKDNRIIEELKNNYEDLHGCSQTYINEYIHLLLLNNRTQKLTNHYSVE